MKIMIRESQNASMEREIFSFQLTVTLPASLKKAFKYRAIWSEIQAKKGVPPVPTL
jgi:hypothetical protein